MSDYLNLFENPNIGTDAVKLSLVDDGSLIDALLQATAHLQLGVHRGGETSYKLIMNGLVHKDAIGRDARLGQDKLTVLLS